MGYKIEESTDTICHRQ